MGGEKPSGMGRVLSWIAEVVRAGGAGGDRPGGERVVGDGFGMEPGAIPAAACRLLGFTRLSDEMRRRVESIVDELIRPQRLVPRRDRLILADLPVAG
jgi:hypothetical protein